MGCFFFISSCQSIVGSLGSLITSSKSWLLLLPQREALGAVVLELRCPVIAYAIPAPCKAVSRARHRTGQVLHDCKKDVRVSAEYEGRLLFIHYDSWTPRFTHTLGSWVNLGRAQQHFYPAVWCRAARWWGKHGCTGSLKTGPDNYLHPLFFHWKIWQPQDCFALHVALSYIN